MACVISLVNIIGQSHQIVFAEFLTLKFSLTEALANYETKAANNAANPQVTNYPNLTKSFCDWHDAPVSGGRKIHATTNIP